MRTQTVKQTTEKKPHRPLAKQDLETVTPARSVGQVQPSFDDLHARITARAYELYAERGYRTGCALEDWVDAEHEILSREFPA